MSDFAANLPKATPDTQTEPQAHAGGTNALLDYSRSAQRSRARQTSPSQGEPFDAATEQAHAVELGVQSEVPATHGSPSPTLNFRGAEK